MLFSIIIPAFNAEKTLCRSIQSILQQSFRDYELIVVDDGSTDDTWNVLSSFDEAYIKIIHQSNRGVSAARNTGIENAEGEYICFLDADDEFLPNHLECLENSMRIIPNKLFYATRFCTVLTDGSITMPQSTGQRHYYANAVEENLKPRKMVCTGPVCIKKSAFDRYGKFVEGAALSEDIDMWERVYVHSGIVIDDTVTVRIHRDDSRATGKYKRRIDADPFDRMGAYLQDETISDDVKKSLSKQFEWQKLEVVRSYLIYGRKAEAWRKMREIDFSYVPLKRRMVTMICFLAPTKLIQWGIMIQNKGKFQELF